ncbi:MAG: glycosyltransferase [Chryseolinea sp.]
MYLLLIIFSVTVAVQIIYFILFIAAFNTAEAGKETTPLPVSVIVCAHDEEQNLRELIPMLLSQQHAAAFEILVVNDRSNDATFDMLLEESSKDHRLKMVHVNRTPPHVDPKKYAITLGIKAARYEWILLTDADCRPQGNSWIATMSKHFAESTNFVLGYSPYQKLPGFLNTFIRFESLLTAIQYISFCLLGTPYMGVGRNLAYRRSKFLESKGFNNLLHITGGDDDLYVNQYATGPATQVCIEPDAQMYSIPKKTWGEFYKQKLRHISVGKGYKFSHKLLLGSFIFTWVLSWLLVISLAAISGNLQPPFLVWFLGLTFFRVLILTLVYVKATKTLGQKFEWWAIVALDFIYAFYYLVVGLRALVTKKVKWKS